MLLLTLLCTKPLLYFLVFALAARVFSASERPWRLPTWAVVLLATLARIVAGFATGWLAQYVYHTAPLHLAFYPVLFGGGFALWLLIARVAFRVPLKELITFAGLAELVSVGVDLLLWREISKINFC